MPLQSPVANVIGTGANPGALIAQDFRIRVSLASSLSSSRASDGDARLRRRYSSSMLDYYPFGGAGFHLSAGGRLDNRHKAERSAANIGSLLYAPKSGLGSHMGGFKRFAPAATVGYSERIGKDLTFGLEAGALIERGDPAQRELVRFARLGSRDDRFTNSASRINPVLQLSAGYHF